MANGNGKTSKDDGDVAAFPIMTELGQFHDVVGRISDCIGDDHDNVPLGMLCVVLRDGEMEQFMLGGDRSTLAMLGALEVAKLELMDYVGSDGDDG